MAMVSCATSLRRFEKIHRYAMYKNQIYSHKCSLVGNTNINWGEMACFHCITMVGAQKYEFVICTSNSESVLSGTGNVRHEFIFRVVERQSGTIIKIVVFNVLLHTVSTHMHMR